MKKKGYEEALIVCALVLWLGVLWLIYVVEYADK